MAVLAYSMQSQSVNLPRFQSKKVKDLRENSRLLLICYIIVFHSQPTSIKCCKHAKNTKKNENNKNHKFGSAALKKNNVKNNG